MGLKKPAHGEAGTLPFAVPCPGEPGKGAKERPDPGKQPVLPASMRCQRWEERKVMHSLPISAAAGVGWPGRSLRAAALPGCSIHGEHLGMCLPCTPISACSADLGIVPTQGKGIWGLHSPLNLWCSGLVHLVSLLAASLSSLPLCHVLPSLLRALSHCFAAQCPQCTWRGLSLALCISSSDSGGSLSAAAAVLSFMRLC